MLIHTNNGIIKFNRTPDGLYANKPSASYLKQVTEEKCMSPSTETIGAQLSNMVLTMTDNIKGYTQHQFENEKRAIQLYHIVVCPTVDNFKHILRKNSIRNFPVKIDDVNISGKSTVPTLVH